MYPKAQAVGVTLLAAFSMLCIPAAATTITTTSYNTWKTSAYITGTTTLVDLTTLEAGMNYSTIAGYTSSGYNFTGPDNGSYYLRSTTEGSYNGLIGTSDGTGYIKVALPNAGNSAFFFDAVCESCGSLSLTLSDNETFTVANGGFGVSISHDITWFELQAPHGDQAFIEWSYFGTSSLPQDQPTQASEAATPVLVGGGLMILLGAGRKKLRQKLAGHRS